MFAEAAEAMRPFLRGAFGNASSVHEEGRAARKAVEDAREQVASLVACLPDEVIFTSGATEANNLALRGLVSGPQDHMVATPVEHPSVRDTIESLQARGATATILHVDAMGRVDAAEAREAVRPRTRLLSAMLANNETGTLTPVAALASVARQSGVPLHTDATQAVGRIPVAMDALGADMLSLSGHKMGGPKGVGALCVRRGLRLAPVTTGGGQERRRRAGTENVAAIVGLGAACATAMSRLEAESRRIDTMRARLLDGVLSRVAGVRLNGDPVNRLPNTLNLSFDGVEGEAVLVSLDLVGVAVSSGSACSSGSMEPSHVLLAMGLTREQARSSVRFSLGHATRDSDVGRVLSVLPDVVARLREMCPAWPS